MIYLKSILVGILAAIAGAMLWLLVPLIVMSAVPLLMSLNPSPDGGIGAIAVAGDSDSLLAAALVCFAMGVYWTFRRGLRRQPKGRSGPPVT
jgi:hypothetical protein